MEVKFVIFLYSAVIHIPIIKCSVPGHFFWKPRIGLRFILPDQVNNVLSEEHGGPQKIFINGYDIGITVLAISTAFETGRKFDPLNPMSTYYYTNLYRWTLRYFKSFPLWLGGQGGHYADTHKVWLRRYDDMDAFVPHWMRPLLFFVNKDEWEKEEEEYKRYEKYAEPSFGRFYTYPKKSKEDTDWSSDKSADLGSDAFG